MYSTGLLQVCTPWVLFLLLNVSRLAASEHSFPEASRLVSIDQVKEFLQVLKRCDDKQFLEEFERDFLIIASEEQERAYLGLPSVLARKAYIEYYWKANDPNPLFWENYALKEHVRRRAYARKHFPAQKPPFYDDRGKYYLRFGEPSIRYEDSGGPKYAGFLGQHHPDAYYLVRANESWSYENVARDYVVHFAQEGSVFKEVPSLRGILVGPSGRTASALQWNDIVKDRASVSPFLAQTATKIEELETALKSAARSGRAGLLSSDLTMLSERVDEISRAADLERKQIVMQLPASAAEPVDQLNQLILHSTVAQFRARDGRTRIELTLYSPLDAHFPSSDSGMGLVAAAYSFLFRDWSFNLAARDSVEFSVSYDQAFKNHMDFAVARLEFTTSPQNGDLTVQVTDRATERIGFSRQRLRIRDFNGPQLMVSDLQFYAPNEESSEDSRELLPGQQLGEREVLAYPSVEIERSRPLLCYFEIYNLKTSGISGEYEVTYKIKEQDDSDSKQASVGFSYTQPFDGDISEELITVDLSQLQFGGYEIEITVSDTKDKELSTTTARFFVLKECVRPLQN